MVQTVAMNNAYASAALRMRAHAESVFADPRAGTADHLFGLAAECALKAILHGRGVIPAPPAFPSDKATRKSFSTHIDRLWGEYAAWAAGESAQLQLNPTSSFGSWRAEDRYQHDNFFTLPRVAGHRTGAQTTAALLEQAIIDGVVE